MTKRTAVTAGLALTAPLAFLGLVLLPVGMVLQIGTQSVLLIENRTDRPLWITPLGTHRVDGRRAVLRQAFSGLLPVPALRGADLPVAPGGSRRVVYRPGEFRASELLVRDGTGDLRLHRPPQAPLLRFSDLPPAPPETAPLASSSPQVLPWAVIVAGLLGLASFAQLLRVRRRLEEQSL